VSKDRQSGNFENGSLLRTEKIRIQEEIADPSIRRYVDPMLRRSDVTSIRCYVDPTFVFLFYTAICTSDKALRLFCKNDPNN
jgi:hypothetical protein